MKLLLSGKVHKISAATALRLALADQYEWCGTKHRVRKMRLLSPLPMWAPCYRTTRAPALQPSIEWCRSRLTVCN